MKLSKWKLMALIIPAAWTSISYAYDWNDDVTQRVQTLIGNAADKYVQGDYDSYNSDTEMAINLLLTIEPQPQSPEQIDARKIQAAQLVDETVKKEIISLEQSLEANQAKADAEYQKMQSMSKEEKEQAAAKAAAEKALAAKAKAAREKAEATSDVDEMLGELGSGKSAPKTHTSTSSGGASMAEISAYTAQVSGMIRSKLPAWDTYKGKRCSVVIHMKPDGKLTGTDSYNGDNDFCNYLKEGLNSIDEFPKVPNQSVYSIIKDASINFKP
ncbi:cell envelope integrity protein TolA [Salmonella enterica subsp. enterica serovar Schwarzengrund]|nr:cell envelope integrity protein TolA [Salmonella enterica subsp. enterica serovar Schwarzengrund]EKB0898892.1 cell envelope integrity protein TolA [Salmonella enterica]EDK7014195.1 protein TolA [Salmonella enterica subsp. enterica serovar Schwarzengrund]EEG4163209.1 cell envelope integrity protein TolA [Salmonella enterica subsp. enterica serovar Schwarzengrund]EKC1288991.1 cell envelope integrity protein TolA [Salmonella enterica subsp. enterica serovar Schwarzengrund]